MSDTTALELAPKIHGQLAREGCCEGYEHSGISRMRAALTAVLGQHPPGWGPNPSCLSCGHPYPCREVRLIAAALGIETQA